MKFLASILALIVLVLTALPCVDKPKDNGSHKMEISANHQHDNHSSENDDCSPFCTCNCCQTNCCFTLAEVNTHLSLTEFNYNELISNYKDIDLFTIPVPPKA